jgi:hypothetical protein
VFNLHKIHFRSLPHWRQEQHIGKGGRSAKKLRKLQICTFAEFKNLLDLRTNFLVVCGLKTSASPQILTIKAHNALIQVCLKRRLSRQRVVQSFCRNVQICDLRGNHKNLLICDLQTGKPKKIADWHTWEICGFAIAEWS